MHRTRSFVVVCATLASVILVACGGGDEGSAGGGAAKQAGSGDVAAPRPSAAESMKQMTADAKSCVDLVKSGRYADAIAPCERAMAEAGNTGAAEVQQAYDEAKAAVAEEARSAGMKAAVDAANGKDPSASAKDALKGFGKGN